MKNFIKKISINITYGNGFSVEYVYNDIELLKEVWYNYTDSTRECAYEYVYTADGQVYKFVDNVNEKTTIYKYDSNKRFIGFAEYAHGENYNDYVATTNDALCENLTEEMLREIAYHDRAYRFFDFLGLEEIEWAKRAKKVDFEIEQHPLTYFKRIIGNLMFW